MKNKKKNGFTIVELVIVIAVIAILSAILIPTFVNLIQKAKMSADQQTVANMNICLATQQAEDGAKKPETFDEMSEVLKGSGYNLPLKPSADGYEYYWIKDSNIIVLVEMNKDGSPNKVVFPKDSAKKYETLPTDDEWFCLNSGAAPAECTHEGDKEYQILYDDGEVHKSSTYHNVICSDCKKVITEQEEHDTDADGACSKCGYKPITPAESFAEYAVWVYTENFSIQNENDKYAQLTISGQPKYGYNSIKEVLDNKDILGGCVIKLNKDLVESVSLTKSMILDLNGHTLTGSGNGAVISFSSYSVEAIELNLFDTDPSANGKITGGNSSSFTGGGAIYVENGTLNMYGGIITGNTAIVGGGISVKSTSSKPAAFNMYGGEISENKISSSYGGGVYISGDSPTFKMESGKITKNTEGVSSDGRDIDTYGAGIAVAGTRSNVANVTITGGIITQNSSDCGAGLYLKYVKASIGGTAEISGNTATTAGGGIYTEDTTLTLGYVTISENSAISTGKGGRGGGIYAKTSIIIVNTGAKIINNTVSATQINKNDEPSASGAGIFWYTKAGDYKLYLAGGEITGNKIEGTVTGDGSKEGAGIECSASGGGHNRFDGVYISAKCKIENNTGAAKGNAIRTFQIAIKTTSDITNLTSNQDDSDYCLDSSSVTNDWDGVVPEV